MSQARSTHASARAQTAKYWSQHVTETSHAMDLEADVFKGSAKEIARSLKRSVERSKNLKSTPFWSALSMLVFYINRAGTNLSDSRRRVLEKAKDELRELFGRERHDRPRKGRGSRTASNGNATP